MPHRRKPFIDKKHATKYRLIPGFVPDDVDEDRFFQTQEELERRKEEQRQYGIFYEDDYDYMKHLRSLTEQATMIKVSDLNDMEDEMRSSYGGSVRSSNFRMFSSTVQVKEERIDSDILASLDEAPEVKMTEEGEIEFPDGVDLLDDDFIARAGGYEYKPALEDIAERQFDPDEQDLGSDFDDFSDYNDFEDNRSDDEECKMREMYSTEGRGTVQDDIIAAQTALILKNFEEGLGFSTTAQQMDEDDGVATTEDYEHLKEILMQEKIKKDKLMSASEFLNNHEDRPNFDYSKFAYEKEAEEEEYEWKDVPPSKPKFDCVSILSLNSNTRNLPTDIILPSSEKRRSKQSSMCETDPSVTVGLSRQELEEEMRLSRKADQASTFRPQDETAEERRMRKKAIKEGRKERRQEKKANKIVFSMEKQKMDREVASLSKTGKGMKLS